MQEFVIERAGGVPVGRRAHVGVVGSGNLEILCEPPSAARARVRIRTTVDGFERIWTLTVERFLRSHDIAADIEINDFGATPATVTLRLEQALEIAA
ncbi:MAG: malonate decarboxylase acyl carrier protein [Candidatus Eremiobacteraeota bacterium]|nr:malonate decarboxylase acyl carrier protein [Candidatus Eremiobacteraeota bacterium]